MAPLSGPPRPIYVGSGDDGRLVPPNWLEQAPVTRMSIALNVAVFVVQIGLTGGKSIMHLPEGEGLSFGASYSLAVLGERRWETLVTACFLHDGLLHIGFNMLALWMAGPIVERAVGSARMAPLYVAAGAFGNLLSVAHSWVVRSAQLTVGASGAISGVIAAALVLGWRTQGWRGPLTQAMGRWLLFVFAFGLMSRFGGGNVDNAAHFGGALAGATIALTWRRGRSYSRRATSVAVGSCAAVLAACVAIVAVHDRYDRFARMTLQDRADFTNEALSEGRCDDAIEGLNAAQRLRANLAPLTSLRNRVNETCARDEQSP
jgi:rhomboid protease GluP